MLRFSAASEKPVNVLHMNGWCQVDNAGLREYLLVRQSLDDRQNPRGYGRSCDQLLEFVAGHAGTLADIKNDGVNIRSFQMAHGSLQPFNPGSVIKLTEQAVAFSLKLGGSNDQCLHQDSLLSFDAMLNPSQSGFFDLCQ